LFVLYVVRFTYKVDDELVKVVRIGPIRNTEPPIQASLPTEAAGLSLIASTYGLDTMEFTHQVLSGVRFASLLKYPTMKTVIPASVWSPACHHSYPPSFKRASKEILLCFNANYVQTKPQPENPPVNVAATLPRDVWLHILSFTHRQCKSNEMN